MIVSPSFLSADFDSLETEILSLSKAEWLHFDVMDGKFVPATTYDETMLKRIKTISKQFFDCHLMIVEPIKHVQEYIDAGADLVTFHYEADPDSVKQTIDLIHSLGVKAGISIKPATDWQVLKPYLNDLDLILIMSVEPGKGGQGFLFNSLDKIRNLADLREKHKYRYLLEVDGGVNFETGKLVREAGGDIIVVGSFLINQKDRSQTIEGLSRV
ncbi:MAG: ribulose-phosphate 3-epimerase [Bacilli bacterium]|nr:ribulose-phosphate 3-epimerase [Bacilli bacterium]MBN2696965.1 ribulose-phosphate 3-epimerase [Bacilli bacterium]